MLCIMDQYGKVMYGMAWNGMAHLPGIEVD